MAHFYNQVSVSTTFAAHGGEDAGFVPKVWLLRLEIPVDGSDAIEYSFDGNTVHGRIGPATLEMPQNGEKRITGGRSRLWLRSSGGGENVDVEAWD